MNRGSRNIFRILSALLRVIGWFWPSGFQPIHRFFMTSDNRILIAHRYRNLVCANIMKYVQRIISSIADRVITRDSGNCPDIQFSGTIGQNQCHHIIMARITVNDNRYFFLFTHSSLFLHLRPLRPVNKQ